jgi:hypothetical protein
MKFAGMPVIEMRVSCEKVSDDLSQTAAPVDRRGLFVSPGDGGDSLV